MSHHTTEAHPFVYKIGISFPKIEAAEVLPLSDLDSKDGFIHLSTKEQVPATVGRFFKEHKKIELLKLKTSEIEHKVKWEQSASHGTFPHIYGDLLASDIHSAKEFSVDDPSRWEALLQDDPFLQ